MSVRFLIACCAIAWCSSVVLVAAEDAEHGHADEHAKAVNAEPGHGDVTAEEDPSHGNEHGAVGAGTGDGHAAHDPTHDPFEDAMHANAGPQQEAPEEWKASLAIWTLVVFGLLLGLLWKFAWGPIRDALDHREKSVQANIDAAAEQHAKAVALLASHEAKLSGAADEIRQLMDNARKEADVQKAGILAEAQAAAESEKNRALQEIEAAKNGAIQELAERSVDAAVGMAGTIVKRELKSDDHSSLISEALKHFPSKN